MREKMLQITMMNNLLIIMWEKLIKMENVHVIGNRRMKKKCVGYKKQSMKIFKNGYN